MATPHSVLLAEPDRNLGEELSVFLQEQGYLVRLAQDAKTALKLAESDGTELLLTEEQLPDQSGLELIRAVMERHPHILSIVLKDQPSDGTQAHVRHIQCLAKPVDLELLHRTMDFCVAQLQAERIHEDWMSAFAHDLKIPLTAIMGCCSLLLGNEDFDEARKRDIVSCIQRNSQRVLAMLDNHLTVSRVYSGELELNLSAINVRPLVEDLIYVMQYEAEKRRSQIRATFEDDTPEKIMADEPLIQRALGNLLSNALKYSPWEAVIDVTVGPAEIEGRPAVEFTVSNPGRGIPEGEIEAVFDRYRRACNMRGVEGIGLGLSVVKMVVEAHSGVVAAESQPDVKTTFHIRLPVDAH